MIGDDPTDTDVTDDEQTGATKREGHGSSRATVRPPAEDDRLSRGTLVGRYVVVDVLGEGGMGVVYNAYDPELDRKVAIKLLQGQPTGGSDRGSSKHGGQTWLMREAQALARLSHPNVIAVHDVGLLPNERVYVAMELVDGMTLRAWLKQPRTWREVREVMLAAGAGLAAAHRSGLIHRDFKPENVLVGHDGRVRVMDFGLARLQGSEATPASRNSDLSIEARSPLSESLTIAGSVLGTPAYLAPEIFDGGSASARSDQFAFGVTLYELLFGTRPYEKRAFAPTPERPPLSSFKPKDPPKSGVPQRLAHIALRAVAIDPEARFASMDALLAELAVDPMRTRRYALLGAGGAALVTAAVVATMKLSSSDSVDHAMLCKGAERHLAGVWDPQVKQTIRAAFEKTTKSFKAKAFTAIESTLDKYTREWTTAVTESCEATKITGVQTADVQSLRQECFDQRLAVLRSFTGLLANADDMLVDKASNAALALEREESVARCADITALKSPLQPSADLHARVIAGRTKLAEAHAGLLAGNFGRAIVASREAVKVANEIKFDPLIAEANFVLGTAMMNLGNGAEAVIMLSESTWAGLRGRHDVVAGQAALFNAMATMQFSSKHDEAKLYLDIARATLARAGKPPRVEVSLLQVEGVIRGSSGDVAGAVAAHQKALARAIEVYGKDNPQLSQGYNMLGTSLGSSGDYAAALPNFKRALELVIPWLGADHPDIAPIHAGYATALHHTGDREAARREFARALEIRERAFGPNSPVLAPTLNNTAELLGETDLEAAIAMSLRAKKLVDRLGKGHPYYPPITSTYGELMMAAGKLDEARIALDAALAAAESSSSSSLGVILAERAHLARLENDWPKLATLATRAIAEIEKSAGKDAVHVWKPLVELAFAKLHDKKPEEARPLLERALAIGTKGKVDGRKLREAREALDRSPKKP